MKIVNFFFLMSLFFTFNSLSDETTSWELLKEGGKIVFIRHAYAPGGGDPNNFELYDCSTQRNLNEQGINQSKRMGILFSKYFIPIDSVYSSEWCRCKETARLAFKNFESLSALNSTFSADYQKNHSKQMYELNQFIKNWDDSQGNLIFVTHYVIVGGFLDYYPSSGEMVITDKSLSVLGTIKINF